MKKFFICFLAIAILVASLIGCTKNDIEESATPTGVPQPTRIPLSELFETLNPITITDITDQLNKDGLPICEEEFFYLRHYESFTKPQFRVINTLEHFNSYVLPLVSGSNQDSNSGAKTTDSSLTQVTSGDISKFTAEYFENYYVVSISIPLSTGSLRANLENVEVGNGVTRIYLSTNMSGEIGTADMLTCHALISLDRSTFSTENTVEVYLNNNPISSSAGEVR